MMTHTMPQILEDLAAGRIDAAEAARRIDVLKAAEQDAPPSGPSGADSHGTAADQERTDPIEPRPAEPSNEELAAEEPSADAWAAATDRPQHPTYTSESFAAPSQTDDSPSAGSQPEGGQPAGDRPERGRRSSTPTADRDRPRRGTNTKGVDRISVRAVGRRIRIVGEPSVATVAADGPHVLRRNGSVLEISSDGEIGASMDGFTLLKTRSLDDIRSLGLGKELFLRVNPDIIVDVEVTAGSLNTEQVPHLGKIRVTAGGAKLLGVEEANDVLVQAGQATVRGSLRSGRSRIRAESGSLNVQLDDDSNVTVHADSQLGKVSWSGGHTGSGDEVVMGNGSARLDVEVVMGHAHVKVGSQGAAEGEQ